MLRAVPKSWFSSDYKLLENDATVAVIDSSGWRDHLTPRSPCYSIVRITISGLTRKRTGRMLVPMPVVTNR